MKDEVEKLIGSIMMLFGITALIPIIVLAFFVSIQIFSLVLSVDALILSVGNLIIQTKEQSK